MAAEKKGKKPDYSGDGIAIWRNTDKNGNANRDSSSAQDLSEFGQFLGERSVEAVETKK